MKTTRQKLACVVRAPRVANQARRPFVFVNMAMTADGKIATTNRTVSSFGSKRDLEHLYELRTTADAVMAGARTLDLNKVLLGAGGDRFKRMRRSNGLGDYSLRIIVSGSGSINPRAAIFQHRFSPILVITTESGFRARLHKLRHLFDEAIISGATEIDFAAALATLRERWKVRRLLCEGGGELNAALFGAGLVDELNLTICPKIIGGRNAPTIAEGRLSPALSEALPFKLHSREQVGDELFLVFRSAKRIHPNHR